MRRYVSAVPYKLAKGRVLHVQGGGKRRLGINA
jgi:hypothetical protein